MSELQTRLKRYELPLLGGAAVAAFVVIGLWSWSGDAPAAVAQAAPPIPVETAVAKRSDVPLYLEGLGTVQAFNTATITTRVDGQLQSVNFAEGQNIRAGEVLAQIDERPYRAAYDQAMATRAKDEAQLANARLDLQRYAALAPLGFSRQTVDTQRALVAQLQAQVNMDAAAIESAKANLDYTTIRAPFAGRVGLRQVDLGNNLQTAGTSTPIVVVTQMQPIAVVFSLPAENLPAVTKGIADGTLMAVAVSRDSETDLDRGTTVVLDNEVNQGTGTLRLKATFANARQMLWPGDFVNVKLLVRTERNVITVPPTAVQRGPNGAFAYVVKSDSTVDLRPLALERFGDGEAVIRSGVQPGETVVTAGQYRLQAGARVQMSSPRVAQTTSRAPVPLGE